MGKPYCLLIVTGVVGFNDAARKRNNLSCLLQLERVTVSVVLDCGPFVRDLPIDFGEVTLALICCKRYLSQREDVAHIVA